MNRMVRQAIEVTGSQAALGQKLGISQAGVHYLLHKAKRLRPEYDRQMRRIVNGRRLKRRK